MIICIQLPQRAKDQLDRLLDLGRYRDYSEAITVAISNQLVLHDSAASETSRSFRPKISWQPEEIDHVESRRGSPETAERQIPPLFLRDAIDVAGIRIAPLPNDECAGQEEISVDQWIFGQHNKLLPVKATCRALANLLVRGSASSEGLSLSKVASEIAGEAVTLGDFLRQVDQRTGTHRDETLAFAFPRSDSTNGDKSRLRFANQFVASLSNQGLLTGLPAELRLVNSDDSRSPRLLLTEAGWHFARLANPVLDGSADRTIKKFSEEESGYLIQHILAHVPAERFAYSVVLSSIAEGANTPDKLDEGLERLLPRRTAKPFTRAFLTTQRAGVVSRLSDLGLVHRIRDGVKVTYEVTERTIAFSPNLLLRKE